MLKSIEDFQNKLDIKEKYKSITRVFTKGEQAPKSKRKHIKKAKQFASFINEYNQKENINFATTDNRAKKSSNDKYNSRKGGNKNYESSRTR